MSHWGVAANVVVPIDIYIYYYYDSGHSELTNGWAPKKRMPPDPAGGILRGRNVGRVYSAWDLAVESNRTR